MSDKKEQKSFKNSQNKSSQKNMLKKLLLTIRKLKRKGQSIKLTIKTKFPKNQLKSYP